MLFVIKLQNSGIFDKIGDYKEKKKYFICVQNLFLFYRLEDVLQVYKESSNTIRTIA